MNEDIYKRLKKIIFTMSILIVAALILLIVLLVKKKKLNNPLPLEGEKINIFKTIEIKEAFSTPNCEPIEVIFKENYIALYSKSCRIIKLIKVR